MIDYFHRHTDLRCGPRDNPAEYILEAIGAGAGAKATLDWHRMWKESEEFQATQSQIDDYHSQSAGRSITNTNAEATDESTLSFSTDFSTQFKQLIVRSFRHYWRSPDYLMAKLMLNIVAGQSLVSLSLDATLTA